MSPVSVTIANDIPYYRHHSDVSPVLAIVFTPKELRRRNRSKLFLMSLKQFCDLKKTRQTASSPTGTLSAVSSFSTLPTNSQQNIAQSQGTSATIRGQSAIPNIQESSSIQQSWFISLSPVLEACGSGKISALCEVRGGVFGFGTEEGNVGIFEVGTHKKLLCVKSAKECAKLSGSVSSVMPYYPKASLTGSEYSLIPWTNMWLVANCNAPQGYVVAPINILTSNNEELTPNEGIVDTTNEKKGLIRVLPLIQSEFTSGINREVGGIGMIFENQQMRLSRTLSKKGDGIPINGNVIDLINMGSLNLVLGFAQVQEENILKYDVGEEKRDRRQSAINSIKTSKAYKWLTDGIAKESKKQVTMLALRVMSTSKYAREPGINPLVTEIHIPMNPIIYRSNSDQLCCIGAPTFLTADSPLLNRQKDLPFGKLPVFVVNHECVYRVKLRDVKHSLRRSIIEGLKAKDEDMFQKWMNHIKLLINTFRTGTGTEYINTLKEAVSDKEFIKNIPPQRLEAYLRYIEKVPKDFIPYLLSLPSCELLNTNEYIRVRNLINNFEPINDIAAEILKSDNKELRSLVPSLGSDVFSTLPEDGQAIIQLRKISNERSKTLEHSIVEKDYLTIAKACLSQRQTFLCCAYLALDSGVHEEALKLFFSPLAFGMLGPRDRLEALRLLLKEYKADKSLLGAALESSYSMLKPTLKEMLVGEEKDLILLEESGVPLSILQRLAIESITEAEKRGSQILK